MKPSCLHMNVLKPVCTTQRAIQMCWSWSVKCVKWMELLKAALACATTTMLISTFGDIEVLNKY